MLNLSGKGIKKFRNFKFTMKAHTCILLLWLQRMLEVGEMMIFKCPNRPRRKYYPFVYSIIFLTITFLPLF